MLESFVLMALGGGPALLEHPLAIGTGGLCRTTPRSFQIQHPAGKPTSLLSANMHTLSRHLRQHCLWQSPIAETSIGLDAGGNFKTAKLKEYPGLEQGPGMFLC